MNTIRMIALLASLSASTQVPAYARDNGQWGDVDPDTAAWFKSVRAPSGLACCDVADGHPVDAQYRDDRHWWAFFEGEWRQVPNEAVVKNAHNPMGRAVVWYASEGLVNGKRAFYIRCFAPVIEG